MLLTIGQVASRVGVTIDTIRFYEKERLIPKPMRRVSGHRQYEPEIIDSITFIRRAKQLGFTLAEIAELMALRKNPNSTAQHIKDKANAKIADINGKITELQKIRDDLIALSSTCSGQGTTAECPIIEAMAKKRKI